MFFLFFTQKSAYEMRISDWSSDVCSSDLKFDPRNVAQCNRRSIRIGAQNDIGELFGGCEAALRQNSGVEFRLSCQRKIADLAPGTLAVLLLNRSERFGGGKPVRSEEHTSELQSLMRNSYAVFCLKQKYTINRHNKL